MSEYVQNLYKQENVGKAELLIMKVTNYAWSEMTLVEQQELREQAARELAALRSENEQMKFQNAEMLEALEALVERIDINGGLGQYKGGKAFAVSAARAAIAKARGITEDVK